MSKYFTSEVINTFINNGIRVIFSPIQIIIISIFLTQELMGFWYTFNSLAAITLIVDAGFTNIITQFSSHEFAFLYWEDGEIKGNEINVNRLYSLFSFSIKWAVNSILIAIPIIFLIGYFSFNDLTTKINWLIPWILFMIGIFINFILNVIFAFFEGCNLLPLIQKFRTLYSIIQIVLSMIFLTFKFDLLSLSLSIIFSSFVSLLLLLLNRSKFLKLVSLKNSNLFLWTKEIIPLFKKYLASWIGGYLSFNLFTYLSFNFINAEFAGKVGFSFNLISSIYSLSCAWLYISVPKINKLNAIKDWKSMLVLIKTSILSSLISYSLIVLIFLISLTFLGDFKIIQDRLLPTNSILILIFAYGFQIVIYGISIYLRSFKEEPLMYFSLFSGIFIVFMTTIILLFLNKNYIFSGFLLSFVILMPWILVILKSKMKLLSNI